MPKKKRNDLKEFRLIVYNNALESRGFYGGRAAASPLAYYYHALKYGKVFLGTGFIFQGLGKKYHSYISEYFNDVKVLSKLPAKIDCDGEKVILSNIGYIYQNYDSLYSSIQNGIFWQYKIEKIAKWDSFKSIEQERYLLSSTDIGVKEEYNDGEDENEGKWRCLVSDFKLIKLKEARLFNGKIHQLFRIYNRDNTESPFYNGEGSPSLPRNNVFIHLENSSRWDVFEKKQRFMNDAKLSPSEIIDSQIKNNHIRESLVHEMLKVLIAEKGWYVNFELPIKNGRIDFLIKKSDSRANPWSVIEVKLLDNPDAVKQLKNYIDAIYLEVKKVEGDAEKTYYWLLWDGKGVKKIKGIILCAEPANNETITEAEDNDFDVWTYKFFLGYKGRKPKNPRLGIKIFDSERKIILKTELKSLKKWGDANS